MTLRRGATPAPTRPRKRKLHMEPFIRLIGSAAPLLRPNIDTDVIIRIERLTSLPRRELGRYALEALRYDAHGRERPDFVLNTRAFREAVTLLADANFGCGSSREGAVWALMEAGIRCVVAPSFGDIFYNNCFQNGLLPIRLPIETIRELGEACAGGRPLEVDLETCRLKTSAGATYRFEIDAVRRESMLNGLDDIGLTLRDDDAIRAWQHADRSVRPWAWSVTGVLA